VQWAWVTGALASGWADIPTNYVLGGVNGSMGSR